MKRHNKRGYFSPATIMALLFALLALGLPFIIGGPIKDDDILTPLPTPETTADTRITATPIQKPTVVTTKKRTDVSPKPSDTNAPTTSNGISAVPAGTVSDDTVKDIQSKAVKLEETALSLYREYGDSLTADTVREKAGVPADEHFIVTVSVKNGNISKVSYFTKDYSVSYSNGKYSALANIADDDFEDRVLFL